MRKLILAASLGACVASNSGCALPIYSADPARRTEQLLFTSENLRMILDEWERAWLLNMPAHTTPFRTHGGII